MRRYPDILYIDVEKGPYCYCDINFSHTSPSWHYVSGGWYSSGVLCCPGWSHCFWEAKRKLLRSNVALKSLFLTQTLVLTGVTFHHITNQQTSGRIMRETPSLLCFFCSAKNIESALACRSLPSPFLTEGKTFYLQLNVVQLRSVYEAVVRLCRRVSYRRKIKLASVTLDEFFLIHILWIWLSTDLHSCN